AIGPVRGAPLWLADGTFLWTTEARGAPTLEVRDRDGKVLRALTTPEFGFDELVGVDGGDPSAIASTDPTHSAIWRVPIAGGAAARIAGGDGVATAVLDHGVTIVTDAK